MQTALLPQTRTFSPHPQTSLLPTAASQVPPHSSNNPDANLDGVLNYAPASDLVTSAAAATIDTQQITPPGLFLGLRAALLFNMALGLTGVVAYELWIAMTH